MLQPVASMTVPAATEPGMWTIIWTVTTTPALSVPALQATWPPDGVAPPVAETNSVLAGTVAVIVTPVAGAFPVLP